MRNATRVAGLCALVALMASGACSTSRRTAPEPSGTAATASPTVGCGATSHRDTDAGFSEVRGIGHHATLYGLLMPRMPLPIRAGEPVKIVWRMTGSGPLRLSVISPDGDRVPLTWGPEGHSGSNFDRPGDEWGAGYEFTSAGCWRLHAERTVGSADLWLRVERA